MTVLRTGGHARGSVFEEEDFRAWLRALAGSRTLFGPCRRKRGQTVFEAVADPADLDLGYCSTMMGPQVFIYPTVQELLRFDLGTGRAAEVVPPAAAGAVLFAVHPCDMQAITVLDQAFLGKSFDALYAKARAETATAVLNCNFACDQGFCESMQTGPFLRLTEGYDLEMTALGGRWLLEPRSARGEGLAALGAGRRDASERDYEKKAALEEGARASFTKRLDIHGLPDLLMRNWDHPVYRETAESRCLSCTNCTKVCPTCYCYAMRDETAFDGSTSTRTRSWDSCQELHFAAVHGGNFRETRAARLRQFVTHKLSTWLEQYGCFGCVGCGRCMTWCPTAIDLSDMAKAIQADFARGKAR